MILGGVLNWGYPNSWMVYFMGNPTKIRMTWGYPHFRKPPYPKSYTHDIAVGEGSQDPWQIFGRKLFASSPGR